MRYPERNCYDSLGVPRNASAKQIKQAYREQMKYFHPDVYPGIPVCAVQNATLEEYCDRKRCGDADRLLAEIRNAIIQLKNPHLMSLYWKIEKEVRPQNYPEYPDTLLDEIAAAVRTINVFHVDSASRKKIINYYNKIEQEVLKSNGKEKS